MKERNQTTEIVETIRQKSTEYQIEPFVLDFLEIWGVIHEKAKDYSLEDCLELSKSILDSHTLPFYEKYKDEECLELYDSWVKEYASIVLTWGKRGNELFPLKLVVYEICYHEKNLLDFFLQKLTIKGMKGDKEALFELLAPVLTNFQIPLDELYIELMRAYQVLEKQNPIYYKQPTQAKFANYLKISTNTALRRMKVINFLNIANTLHFLDIAKLGYETTLLIHQDAFPKQYEKYLRISTDLGVGTFSIVQIPYKKTKTLFNLEQKLLKSISQSITKKTTSWNLTGLSPGIDNCWQDPPPFLHGKANVPLITPSPDLNLTLKPTFQPFRALTPADIKILDFLTTKGSFTRIKQFSEGIKVSVPEITKRLKEYGKEKLLAKTIQYFNIGLDLTLFFYISTKDNEIPWLQHFQTFPKINVFYQEEEYPHYYFGYLKMPNHWIKPFARQVDLVKRDYGVKFYYKIASAVDHIKWAISLAETYA